MLEAGKQNFCRPLEVRGRGRIHQESWLSKESCLLDGGNAWAFVLPLELKLGFQFKGERSEARAQAHGIQIFLVTKGDADRSRMCLGGKKECVCTDSGFPLCTEWHSFRMNKVRGCLLARETVPSFS